VSWEEGFCDGLLKSRIFVPLLSKKAINNPANKRCDFTALTPDSPCDNVLLEHNIALELAARGLVERIYPVMIGEPVEGTSDADNPIYSNYFASGAHPNLVGDVIVTTVVQQLEHHLDRSCLGTPLLQDMTVKNTLAALLVNQGCFFEKSPDDVLKKIVGDVKDMMDALLSSSPSPPAPPPPPPPTGAVEDAADDDVSSASSFQHFEIEFSSDADHVDPRYRESLAAGGDHVIDIIVNNAEEWEI
jgi:hypothetical protein